MNSEQTEFKTLKEEYLIAIRKLSRVKSRDLSPPDPYLVRLNDRQVSR